MKEFIIKTTVKEMALEELAEDKRKLVEAAQQATYRSYAPYSLFRVGAAIQLSDGNVVTGANQENAAYPSGTCAERSACYYAHAAYPEAKFVAIAIAARDTHGQFTDEPISPCGACRQALLEYEKLAGASVQVLLAGVGRVFVVDSVRDLLPLAFVEFG